MNNHTRLDMIGLTAAPHTPFGSDGSLNLAMVEKQAEHLATSGIHRVFITGTTGECHSLSTAERKAVVQRWLEVSHTIPLRVLVHAGSNSLGDACELAAHAAKSGAAAIATVSPSYFKPSDVSSLVTWCLQIAEAAPDTPFFYYDIPMFTGVRLPVPEFLAQARDRIPNLAGVKFTNPDLLSYQECVRVWGKELEIVWGLDELLLAALVFGCRAAIGATYNFAAPLYQRLMAAFEKGDLETARAEQFRSLQMVKTLSQYGFFGASKAVMRMVGVDVGPARLPNHTLSAQQFAALESQLQKLGFFEWIVTPK